MLLLILVYTLCVLKSADEFDCHMFCIASCFVMFLTCICWHFVCCESRRDNNRKRADDQLEKLRDALLLQQFFQDCDEVCR